jgi:hypothetical protein
MRDKAALAVVWCGVRCVSDTLLAFGSESFVFPLLL